MVPLNRAETTRFLAFKHTVALCLNTPNKLEMCLKLWGKHNFTTTKNHAAGSGCRSSRSSRRSRRVAVAREEEYRTKDALAPCSQVPSSRAAATVREEGRRDRGGVCLWEGSSKRQPQLAYAVFCLVWESHAKHCSL